MFNRPQHWSVGALVRQEKLDFLGGFPQFTLFPASESSRDQNEWIRFLTYLKKNVMVRTFRFLPCALLNVSELQIFFLVIIHALDAFFHYFS